MRFGRNDRKRRAAVRIALVLALASAIAVALRPSGTAAHAGSGKRGSLVVSLSVPAHPELNGGVRPEIVSFVPAGSEFMLFAEYANAPGAAVVQWEPEFEPMESASASASASKCSGEILGAARASIRLRAPTRPGLYRVIRIANGERRLAYPIFVTLPAKRSGPAGSRVRVAGKLVGAYPDPKRSSSRRVRAHAEAYRPPAHFIEITVENEHVRLCPHLELGQCIGPIHHRDVTGPVKRHFRFFPPSRRLLEKVEALARSLKAQGIRFEGFRVNSGFRTPAYNRRIHGSRYSRHLYGDALDLMIDENPADGRMDDLNGDGRIDRHDGLIIADAIRELENAGAVAPGGIGVYEYSDPKSVGCHVHIDARGFPTRWGVRYRGRRKAGFQWWPPGEYSESEKGR